MKKTIAVLLIVLVLALMVAAPTLASPQYQETETPTPTAAPYVIVNTVSVGEYGIATILSAQCLLLIVIATALSLWVFLQKRRG